MNANLATGMCMYIYFHAYSRREPRGRPSVQAYFLGLSYWNCKLGK